MEPNRIHPGAARRLQGAPWKISVVLAALAALPCAAQGTPGQVLGHQKISATEGGLTGALVAGDNFGSGVTSLQGS